MKCAVGVGSEVLLLLGICLQVHFVPLCAAAAWCAFASETWHGCINKALAIPLQR